jgi:quercetin dioxygenase-like cupin family protein
MTQPEALSAGMPSGEALRLSELVSVQSGAVVSRTLLKTEGGSLTLFAFDRGQGLSEHTAPFDAVATVLEGEAELTVGGRKVPARPGESVLMPAGVPHAVHAPGAFKMLLIMVRGTKRQVPERSAGGGT